MIFTTTKTWIKCLFIFISLIAMFCCREKGKDNAYLNAFIMFLTPIIVL